MLILECLWFLVPAGLANMAPVLVKRRFGFLAIPIDFNRTLKGKPIFGKNKTWRGLILGILAGVGGFAVQKWLYQFLFFKRISLIDYNHFGLMLGFLLGLGAIVGDLMESFFKRRINISPGQTWFPFDQIDWILGSLAFSSILYFPSFSALFIIISLGFGLHPIANYTGYLLRIKKNKF